MIPHHMDSQLPSFSRYIKRSPSLVENDQAGID